MMVTGCIVSTLGMSLSLILFLVGPLASLVLLWPDLLRGPWQRHHAPQRQCRDCQRAAASCRFRLRPRRRHDDRRGAALSALAGAILSAESGPYPLITVMLVSCIIWHVCHALRDQGGAQPCPADKTVTGEAAVIRVGGVLAGGRGPHGRHRQTLCRTICQASRPCDQPLMAQAGKVIKPRAGSLFQFGRVSRRPH
jgi:hypothetical protein